MGDSLLTVSTSFLVFSDEKRTSDPRLRDIDYKRTYACVRTGDFDSKRISLPAGQSEMVAQTARSITLLTTSQFRVVNVSSDDLPARYRVLHIPGVGSPDPDFRTRRDLDHDDTTGYNVTVDENVVTLTWSGAGPSPDFAGNGVVVGDQVRIEEGGPFNESNWGTFDIISVSATAIRWINEDAAAESGIVLGTAIDGLFEPLDCFGSDGVQIDDEVLIRSTALLPNNRGTFTVLGVTPSYFEIENTAPGIEENPITIGSTEGFVFYPDIYGWLYVESDKTISIRLNGDTSDRCLIEPVDGLSDDGNNEIAQPGIWLARTRVWSLELANNGIELANIRVMLAR